MRIGQRIKKIRSDQNLTQKELASKAKISRSYLADVENDRYNPSLSTLKEIAGALNVSTDRITGESVSSIIEDRLEDLGISVSELAEKANTPEQFITNIDDIIPDEGDYALIARIAKALDVPPSTLRAALARQEPPVYDGPTSSAEDDFKDPVEKDGEITSTHDRFSSTGSLITKPRGLVNPSEQKEDVELLKDPQIRAIARGSKNLSSKNKNLLNALIKSMNEEAQKDAGKD